MLSAHAEQANKIFKAQYFWHFSISSPQNSSLSSFLGFGGTGWIKNQGYFIQTKHQQEGNPKRSVYRNIFESVSEDKLHPLVAQPTVALLCPTALARQLYPFTCLLLHAEPSMKHGCTVSGLGLNTLASHLSMVIHSDLHVVTPSNTRKLHYNIPMKRFKSLSHPLAFYHTQTTSKIPTVNFSAVFQASHRPSVIPKQPYYASKIHLSNTHLNTC